MRRSLCAAGAAAALLAAFTGGGGAAAAASANPASTAPAAAGGSRMAAVTPSRPLRLPATAGTRPDVVQTLPASPVAATSTAAAGDDIPFTTPSTAPLVLQTQQGTIQSGQTGAFGSDQAVAPPDPDIAAGGPWVVETTNESLVVRQRNGAPYPTQAGACPTPGPSATNYVAYSLAGCNEIDLNNLVDANGWILSDPRILYDPGAGQFYLSIFLTTTPTQTSSCFPEGGFPDGETCSIVLVLHTTNGDPTGQWEGWDFPSYHYDVITDQPTVGFSGDKIGVSWNEFDVSDGAWLGDEWFVMSKSIFLADVPQTDPVIDPQSTDIGPPTTSFFGLFPVSDLSSGSTLYFVANDASPDLPGLSSPSSILVLGISGDTPGTISSTTQYPGTAESSAPPVALQKGTTDTIDTDDDRIDAGAWSGGALWTAFNETCSIPGDTTDRACIRYVEINTGTGAIPTSFDFGISGAYVYYPSIGIDPAGDFLSTFTTSSGSTFPSVMAVGLAAGQALLSSPITVVTGTGPYDDASTGDGVCSTRNDRTGATTACRYGDFGGGAVDATDPEDFWFADEVQLDSGTASDWGSEVGRLTYAAPSITGFTPSVGPAIGGTVVTVAGADFAPTTVFTFNGSTTAISNVTPDAFTFTTPAHAAGTVTGYAHDVFGSSSPATSYLYVAASRYQPLTPYRVLDTRSATCVQCTGGALGPASTRTIEVGGYQPTGFGGTIVPATATAVVLNVTAISGTALTYLTVFPAGGAVPTASSVNANAQSNIANLVTVALGASGSVSIYNAQGTINVAADVEGYYFASGSVSGTAGTFHPLSPPVRVCDTRGGQGTPCNGGTDDPLTGGEPSLVAVSDGSTGVATGGDAAAVVLNLTAISGTAGTYLSVYPPTANGAGAPTCGSPPNVSNLNVPAGTNQPNRVITAAVEHAGTGYVCLFNDLGTINVAVDINGWFGNGSDTGGTLFYPLGPSRICDTRFTQGTQCAGESLTTGGTLSVVVDGTNPLPASGIAALIANVTAVSGTASTYFTVYPDAASRSMTSDLNPSASTNIANLVIVAVPADGKIDIYNSLGAIDVVVDAVGWFQ